MTHNNDLTPEEERKALRRQDIAPYSDDELRNWAAKVSPYERKAADEMLAVTPFETASLSERIQKILDREKDSGKEPGRGGR